MRPLKSLSSLLLSTLMVQPSFAANPTELPSARVTRAANTGLTLETTLTKNLFRQEAYDAEYTVTVPYQATETYYETVPYTVSEPYTDYETYYDNEYRCRDVVDHRRECRDEQVCRDIPGEPICEIVRDCESDLAGIEALENLGASVSEKRRPPGGGDDHDRPGRPDRPDRPDRPRPPEPRPEPPRPRPPEPRPEPPRPRPEPPKPRPPEPRPEPPRPRPEPPKPRPPEPRPEPPRPRPPEPRPPHPEPPKPRPPRPPECRERKVCRPGPSRRVCENKQVCRDVPVRRQECGWEQVAKTRPVTRYRDVTYYRQEERTRTVTRYREETRCCVTKYRDVFDHQWTQKVAIQFPAEAALLVGETESFDVSLLGSEQSPDAQLVFVDTIYGYQVAEKKFENGQVIFVLKMVPRYSNPDLTEATIKNFTVAPADGKVVFSFNDNTAAYRRVQSQRQLRIEDSVTREVVAISEVAAITQKSNAGEFAANLDTAKQYDVVLKINRSGPVIGNGGVDFEVRQPLSFKLDMDALKSDRMIAEANIVGRQEQGVLVFKDLTAPYANVATAYTITVVRKNESGRGVEVSNATFQRGDLTKNAEGFFTIPLSALNMSADQMRSYVQNGMRLNIVVEVRRQVPNAPRIQFWKDNWIQL